MPWKVVSEDGKYKVYKLGADNKPTGKPVGTHSEKPKADAQLRALYASEKKPKETTVHIDGDSAVSATITGDIENATTNFTTVEASELETKDYYGDEVPFMYASGPLTFADLMAQEAAQEAAHEIHELTYSFQRLASNIMSCPEIEDKAAALSALANEYAGLVGEKAKLEAEDKAASIAKQIAGDNCLPV